MSRSDRPPMTWRVVALVVALVLEVVWGGVLGWWPIWTLIAVLTVDGLWAWSALLLLLRRQSRETPRVSTPPEPADERSAQVCVPASVKERAKAVRERLRTDRLID